MADTYPVNMFGCVNTNGPRVRKIKAGAPYVFSRYGKEYGTPATRLLFEGTIEVSGRCVRTVSDILKNKVWGVLYCTLAIKQRRIPLSERAIYPAPNLGTSPLDQEF